MDYNKYRNKNEEKKMAKGRKAISLAARIRRERIKENLNELLKKRGMTPKELAEKTGIAYTTINNYRRVYAQPSLPSKKNLLAMAKALNCEPDEIDPSYLQFVVTNDKLDNKENLQIFSSNLEALISREGLTYKEFCENLGISYRALWGWATGEIKPSEESLELLSKHFRIPIKDLLNTSIDTEEATKRSFEILQHIPSNLSKEDKDQIINFIEFIKFKNKRKARNGY